MPNISSVAEMQKKLDRFALLNNNIKIIEYTGSRNKVKLIDPDFGHFEAYRFEAALKGDAQHPQRMKLRKEQRKENYVIKNLEIYLNNLKKYDLTSSNLNPKTVHDVVTFTCNKCGYSLETNDGRIYTQNKLKEYLKNLLPTLKGQ